MEFKREITSLKSLLEIRWPRAYNCWDSLINNPNGKSYILFYVHIGIRIHRHQGIILLFPTLKQNSLVGWDIQIHGRLANKKIYFQREWKESQYITISVLLISASNKPKKWQCSSCKGMIFHFLKTSTVLPNWAVSKRISFSVEV